MSISRKNGANCKLCKNKFEFRQGINDEPLKRCPECDAEIKRLFSRPFLGRRESLSHEGAFDYMGSGAYEFGSMETSPKMKSGDDPISRWL